MTGTTNPDHPDHPGHGDCPEARDQAERQRQPDLGLSRRLGCWARRLLAAWPHEPSHDRDSELRVGWTVRLDWPDGSHDLVGFHPRLERAERKRRRLQRYWRHGPLAPIGYRVVAVDETGWRTHTRQADAGRARRRRRLRSGSCVDSNCPGNGNGTDPTQPARSSWSSWLSGSSGWTKGER